MPARRARIVAPLVRACMNDPTFIPATHRSARRPLTVAALRRLCARLPDVTATLSGAPDSWLVYTVRGRKFAYFKTSEPERWRFSVRVTPDRFVELTEMPGVKPSRWRGRYGWITIVAVARFPRAYLEALVHASYERARRGRA